jgi:beta-mannosidase
MTMTAAPIRTRRPSLDVWPIDTGWEVASAPAAPAGTGMPDGLTWLQATVPGTVPGALRAAGQAPADDIEAGDWWFRTRIDIPPGAGGQELVLRIGGMATISEVWLADELVASSDSMFRALDVDLTGRTAGSQTLAIRCLALTPRLAEPRRPRARWRTALVTDGNLRWFRTSLLGRAPGFSPGPPIVGPWRPITLERRRDIVVEDVRLRATLEGDDGLLDVRAVLRTLDGTRPSHVTVELAGPSGRHRARLEVDPADGGACRASLRIPRVATWWPHTHGIPALHSVRLTVAAGLEAMTVDAGRVGFRAIAAGPDADHDLERNGLDLHVNGTRVFARGAVWTPLDPIGMAATNAELRRSLELARSAGMNLLRIPGTGVYESLAFHDLCDELGIMVWQDLMFANLDYPFVDDGFRKEAEAEVASVVEGLAARPSTVVVCGNSEVEQQVAMLGLDPAIGRDSFYAETLPRIVAGAESDAIVVRSAPFGGDLPFRPDRGVANYYGVGGYRRPLSDARTSGVRYAAECLAISNVPDDPIPDLADPAWKAGIPGDRGADWDFEDVRDHYLGLLYGVDPVVLRNEEPARYLALSRAVSGEVMAEVFGEWRRAGSPSGGGLILWWRDVVAGAGWGLVARDGAPKAAYHHVRRAFAPVAIWMTDEGLGGITVHVANDGARPLVARLRVALYRDGEVPVGSAEAPLDVAAHTTVDRDLEAVLGHFVDASWAYRFGPPAQDLVVATLESIDGDATRPLGQAVRYPVGRPSWTASAEDLGLTAAVVGTDADRSTLELSARRVAHGMRIVVPDFMPDDDAFDLEPGHARRIDLQPIVPGTPFRGGRVTAVNLTGDLGIES